VSSPYPVLYNGLGTSQGIYETTTSAVVAVGTRAALSDGRVYYYARSNSATTILAGVLLSAEVASVDMDDMGTAAASVGATSAVVTPVGSKTYVENELAEGYWCMNSGTTGMGIAQKIKSHLVTTATTAFTVNFYDALPVALTGTETSHVVKNVWMDPVAAPTANQGVSAGVSQVAVPAGDSNAVYYWAQTWGPACVLAGEGTAIGVSLMNDNAEGRTVTQAAASVTVAEQYTLGVDGDFVMAFMRVAP
jgi:hypothetical protein